VFLHPVGFAGHVVHSAASGARNVHALFFMLGGTRYAELVNLHSVRSAGHVTHSSASGARNIDALYSCFCQPGAVSIKSMSRHVTPNLCFCIR
jgi:hypothetical protein